MIAGGESKWTGGYEHSAYILNIYFDDINPMKIVSVSHSSLPRIPFKYSSGFYEFCQGRLIIGGGDYTNQVAELDGIDFMDDLPSTKIQREDAAAVYHSGNKTLIVSGGIDKNKVYLDSIEMLKIDTNSNDTDWILHHSTLPHPLHGHTMTQLRNEIVLIGGDNSYEKWTNEVWKGIIQGNEISFEQLPSMKNWRSYHFAFAIHGNIYVFGGEYNRHNSKIEIYDPIIKKWTDGPHLPCYLSKKDDCAVMNRQGKIILVKYEKIGIFDPEDNSIVFFEGQFVKGKEFDRRYYAALLI